MAENRIVAVVNDFEAITRPKARLRTSIMSKLQASVMAVVNARRKPDSHGIHNCYPE